MKPDFRVITLAAATAFLTGCAMQRANENVQKSLAAYKACLAQHPQDVSACEGARLTYETDQKEYQRTTGDLANSF